MKLGRFSGKVKASRAKQPEGVSRTEGWWLLLLASLIALFVLSRLLSKGGGVVTCCHHLYTVSVALHCFGGRGGCAYCFYPRCPTAGLAHPFSVCHVRVDDVRCGC